MSIISTQLERLLRYEQITRIKLTSEGKPLGVNPSGPIWEIRKKKKQRLTMTRTIYRPVAAEESDLAVLNLSRLLARLEHNLLSPSADLKPLRQSEFHRARVGAVS